MASQRLKVLLLMIIFALPFIKTSTTRTKLDHLKADILKHVLEKEANNEETDTALKILRFILGTREGNSEAEWEAAKAVIRENNEELYQNSQDQIDDFIGLYEVRLSLSKYGIKYNFRTISTTIPMSLSTRTFLQVMKLEMITAMFSNILICLQARKLKTITTSLSMKIYLQVMAVMMMIMNIIKT